MFRSLVFFGLVSLASSVSAKTLTCIADAGEDSKGWIPDRFSLSISDDRQLIEVLNPITDVFGAKSFEKAFIGSSYWSRGKGKSSRGEFYNFQLQLSLKDNDSRYSMELSMQGYNSLRMKGSCSTSDVSPSMSSSRSGSSVDVSAQDCSKIFGPAGEGFVKLTYAYLKLGLIDPAQSLKELKTSPVMEACIDKGRGSFLPIREFIQRNEWKRPLSAGDCREIGWPQITQLDRTLAKLDETFRTTAWEGSPKKAVDDWCEEIFEKK